MPVHRKLSPFMKLPSRARQWVPGFLVVCGLLSLSAFAQGFSDKSETLCSDCTSKVKRLLRKVQFPEASKSDLSRVAFVIVQQPRARQAEAKEIESKIVKDVIGTPFGRSLIEKASQSGGSDFRLFHQVSIDSQGSSSISNVPQELAGFSSTADGHVTVFLHASQRPSIGMFTLVHELTHLFDEKTRIYLDEQKAAGEWTELDDLAMEFRGLLGEMFHYMELVKPLGPDSLLPARFGILSQRLLLGWNGRIDLNAVAEMTIEMAYPRSPSNLPVLSVEEALTGYDLRDSFGGFGTELSPWAISPASRLPTFLESVIGFVQASLRKCQGESCPLSSVALLNYRQVPFEDLQRESNEGRRRIESLLRARGADSFLDYLQKRGLVSDLEDGLKLRDYGVNEFRGPRTRLGGGSLRTLPLSAPETER